MQDRLREWAGTVNELATQMLAQQLDARCPEESGQLKVSQIVTLNGLESAIDYPVEYASFTDEGTQPHVIEGNPLLAFETGDGELVIVRSVFHPGTERTGWYSDLMTDENYQQALDDASSRLRF